MTGEGPVVFGVRHLSPAGAHHLLRLLDERRPRLVLIEGPSDLSDQMADIAGPHTKPPIAIMAYTQQSPIRTVLYPFALYSPEYQAILWAHRNRVDCRFIDLPSGVFLALAGVRPQREGDGEEQGSAYVYRRLDELSGEGDHEVFWERVIEHSLSPDSYRQGAGAFGAQLRELAGAGDGDYAENLVREAYMKRQIAEYISRGYDPGEIVVVTGAYHVQGLLDGGPAMSDEEEKSLPMVAANKTLMPYSYYRLSSRSGYGAGNKAPAYYQLLWKGLERGDLSQVGIDYLSRLAAYQRRHGNLVSSAEVIEAARLAHTLAGLHGGGVPALRDLRDAAVTCMGHGHLSEIAQAVADTEIGAEIGALPQGVSRTSIQEDFYRLLGRLKLEKYQSVVGQELALDLREKLTVKSEQAAFLDLERSFFLHRVRVLDIGFAAIRAAQQDKATWAERWLLRWTPEAEIQIVEAALKGDTVAQAASFALKERTQAAGSIAQAAAVIEDAFLCGMPEAVQYATAALQELATDAAALHDIAATARSLSQVIRYGSIRRLDSAPLLPVLSQLFLRANLLLAGSCVCDNAAAGPVIEAMGWLNETALSHDELDGERWQRALWDVASRDDLNPKASGYAMAILLERGQVSAGELANQVQLRLSRGVPADLGASWFEGLAQKNRYALIARLSLWEQLNGYLDDLDDEEFKRALVFLRRAFADFSPKEKADIAENLGEVWGINPQAVSEAVNQLPTQEEQELLEGLDDFDFTNI